MDPKTKAEKDMEKKMKLQLEIELKKGAIVRKLSMHIDKKMKSFKQEKKEETINHDEESWNDSYESNEDDDVFIDPTDTPKSTSHSKSVMTRMIKRD